VEELEGTRAYTNQAAALARKMLSAALAERAVPANSNREAVKERKIPFAVLAAHVTQANRGQEDAKDRRTPSAQIALCALQDFMLRESVDGILRRG